MANGSNLVCESVCKGFNWKMQEREYAADVYILPLQNFDMVLDIQWLS